MQFERLIQYRMAGVDPNPYDIEKYVEQFMMDIKTPMHEDITKISIEDLVKKINDVGSNKKSIMFLIGNGINRLKNSKNTNGVLLLTAALSLLAGAGDDASLINLAKRIAYTGLTGR